MKTRWIYSIALILFTSTCILQAQNSVAMVKSENTSATIQNNGGFPGSSPSSSGNYNNYLSLGEECNMCLYDDWKNGTLIMKDETVINNRPIRYNIYNQQMEFIFENDTSALANPEEFDKIMLAGHTFVFGPFLCNESIHRGYMELLYEGEASLYLHRFIKYTVIDKSTGPELQEDQEYFREDRYFYSNHTGPAKPFPLKKKQILELFNDPQKDVKLFLKESKNKLSTKEDFIQLFQYYYSNSPTL